MRASGALEILHLPGVIIYGIFQTFSRFARLIRNMIVVKDEPRKFAVTCVIYAVSRRQFRALLPRFSARAITISPVSLSAL